HWSNPCQGAQSVVISSSQRLCGLGKQCGEIGSADSWPGAKDRHVTLPAALPRRAVACFELGAQAVQVLLRLLDLLIDQMQTCRKAADMRAGGLCRAGRHEQRWLPQSLEHRRRIEAADAVLAQEARDRLLGDLGRTVRGWHLLPKRQEPVVGDIVGQPGGLRIIPPQLLAQAVGKTCALLL